MLKYLASEVKYPQACYDNGIQGTVYVSFVVEKDGHISTIKVINENEMDQNLVAEAARVVCKMPKWTSGMQEGEPVKVKFTIPILFAFR